MKKRLVLTLVMFLIMTPFAYIGLVELGASRESPTAQGVLGRWYEQGLWLHFKNQDKALYWYEKAAKANDPMAQFNLGLLIANQGNFELAATWYLRSALQDYDAAQNNLANLYKYGRGVKKSSSKANVWFEKAALQGNRNAQYSLGALIRQAME